MPKTCRDYSEVSVAQHFRGNVFNAARELPRDHLFARLDILLIALVHGLNSAHTCLQLRLPLPDNLCRQTSPLFVQIRYSLLFGPCSFTGSL